MARKFWCDESGAVTIDWVSLTAGILLLGIAVVYGIFQGGVLPLSESVNSSLAVAVDVPGSVASGPPDDFSGKTAP